MGPKKVKIPKKLKEGETLEVKLPVEALELINVEELEYLVDYIGKSRGVKEAVGHIMFVRNAIRDFHAEGKVSAWPNIEPLRGYKVTLSLPHASFLECRAISVNDREFSQLIMIDEGNVIRHTSILHPGVKLFCLGQGVGFFSNRCIIEKDPSFTPDLKHIPKELALLIMSKRMKRFDYGEGGSFDDVIHAGIMQRVSQRKLHQQEGTPQRGTFYDYAREQEKLKTNRLLKYFLYKGHPLPPGMMVKRSSDTYQLFLRVETSLTHLHGYKNINDNDGVPLIFDKGGHYVLSAPYAKKLIPIMSRFMRSCYGKVGFPPLTEAELGVVRNIKSGLISHSKIKPRYNEFIKRVSSASNTLTSSQYRTPTTDETWGGYYACL